MSDTSIPNSWNNIARYSKEITDENKQSVVRVYTYSPEAIAIQIRTSKGYATAILSDAQARLISNMIIEAIEDH